MFAKEDEAETLEIVLADRVSGLKAHLQCIPTSGCDHQSSSSGTDW